MQSTASNIEFLCHAFSACGHNEMPWVAGFPGDLATVPHHVWFGSAAFPLPSFIRANTNNYVCISTFNRANDGRYRRRKDCWAGMWIVLLDDLGTKIPLDMLRQKPSCLVETSPGNFQAWLFLTQPERNINRAEALINGLIAAGASDPGAGNVTRYGRLPIGVNGKAKHADKDGAPFTQRVHIWQPEQRYSVDEIAAAYGINLDTTARPRNCRALTAPKLGSDGYLALFEWAGLYLESMRGTTEGHRIICPWHQGHTNQDTTGTAYWEPSEENDWHGGFKCHHGTCKDRNISDLDNFALGLLRLRHEKAKVSA